jgi:hypothetical protein
MMTQKRRIQRLDMALITSSAEDLAANDPPISERLEHRSNPSSWFRQSETTQL